MLTSLHIKNFRGFRDLTIQPLARVNLIAGKNNVGKTGILEALFLLFPVIGKFYSFPSIFRSGLNNKDDIENYWRWLPYKKDRIRLSCAASYCFKLYWLD